MIKRMVVAATALLGLAAGAAVVANPDVYHDTKPPTLAADTSGSTAPDVYHDT